MPSNAVIILDIVDPVMGQAHMAQVPGFINLCLWVPMWGLFQTKAASGEIFHWYLN